MLVALLLTFGLMQSGANQATSQPQPATPAATAAPPVSSSGLSQLQAEAEAGNATAQEMLGRAYEDGNDVPQDYTLAAKWYRKAADQGNAVAQNNLGIMYRTGSGVEKSKEEAVKWYKLASRQKYASAMFNLGAAYYNGDGVEMDEVTAYAWFLLAEEAGSKAASAAARRSEAEMKPGGIEQGLLRVAGMYESGVDLNRDMVEAIKWYRRAAEKGNAEAQVKLADRLSTAETMPRNYDEARSWCELAAAKDYAPGAYCLGRFYRIGLGVSRDPQAAEKWFQKGAWLGDGHSMLQLGEMYQNGEGVKANRITAYTWMLLALSCRDAEAGPEARSLQREMSKKEIERAQEKAAEFLRKRPFAHLRVPVSATN
jgi:TPR repeat protein